MLRMMRLGIARRLHTLAFGEKQGTCGFPNRAPSLTTLFAVGLLSCSPTIALSQVHYREGVFWKIEQAVKSPECIEPEQAKNFIYYAESKLIEWIGNTMVYDDDDNSLETADGKKLIEEIKKKVCPPVIRYHVGGGLKPKLFEPVPPGTSTDDESQERQEIGSSGRTWTGPYFGVQTLENFGRVRTTETSAATGAVTNQFSDSGDPPGGGIVAGFNFTPWDDVVIGPFISLDWLHQTINHSFSSGFNLGTTTHWIITAGAKAGYKVTPDWLLYGLVGVAGLNQNLVINFARPVTSQNTLTPGLTLGFGGEWQPAGLQIFGAPVALFLQYQHTWWGREKLNRPSSSPHFNYVFKRDDDTIKFGFNVYYLAP